MNIILLQTYLSIIENGSLVKASYDVCVTQSTITTRLKQLEDEVGQKLIYRQKSGITLTYSGIRLKEYAETMVHLWQQAKLATSLASNSESICLLACHSELWHDVGKKLFEKITEQSPQMGFKITQGFQVELEKKIMLGYIDLVITYDSKVQENQTLHVLLEDELVLYSTRKHSPAKGDLFYTYIDHGREFQIQHSTTYADAGIARINFQSTSWALDYMLHNKSSGYLPKRLAKPYVEKNVFYEVSGATVFKRKVYLIVNDLSTSTWVWLPKVIQQCSQEILDG